MSKRKRLGGHHPYKPTNLNDICPQVISTIATRNQQGFQTTLFKHIRQRLYRQATKRRFSSYVPTKGAIFYRCTSSGLIKDRDGHGLQLEEITMRLITRFELAGKTSEELHSLLRQTFNAVASGDNNHKRNAIASMQNIQNELVSRLLRPY
jgi:hypothetical protein